MDQEVSRYEVTGISELDTDGTSNYHNTFERHHRFIGWLGVAATWVFVVTGNTYDIKTGEWRSDAHALISTQELWFAVFLTIL